MNREGKEGNRNVSASAKDIVGWDIGAANVKAAWLSTEQDTSLQVRVASQPFEIWREKERLPEVLKEVFAAIAGGATPGAMAITTTAELSDVFATKREGVLFVFESIQKCFPDIDCQAFSLSGKFIPLKEASARPLDFAAANWLASAQWIARKFLNCLLVDVGSTTTDILPIIEGKVAVGGSTDMARLALGELVFTGALRTNLAAVVQTVPVAGQVCRVASEYFSVTGDVHLILGNLRPQDYKCSTPDGQSPSMESARRRLARIVCADTEMLSASDIDEMARFIYDRQIQQICDGLNQVISRFPLLCHHPVINVGMGAFLGRAAAGRLGMEILDLENEKNHKEIAVTSCIAVARLLAEALEAGLV
jgi:probable H4MPT-linked C1 transfer pathway protein